MDAPAGRILTMPFYWFLLGSLGVWRIVHLLNSEDGPGDLLARWRKWAGAGWLGHLLDCFYCLSIWVAAPFACAIGVTWKERLLLWPALSGAAIVTERLTAREAPAAPAAYTEDGEPNDVLRTEQNPDSPWIFESAPDGGRTADAAPISRRHV